MGLWGFREQSDALVAKQLVVERRARSINNERITSRQQPFWGGGGGATAVAITTQIIPARSGTTPGGAPDGIPVTIQKSSTGSAFAPGTTVNVYSWVQSDSPDPDGEWSGYIYISQDQGGTWWYHAVDCTPPPPAYATLPDGSTIPSDGTEVVYIA